MQKLIRHVHVVEAATCGGFEQQLSLVISSFQDGGNVIEVQSVSPSPRGPGWYTALLIARSD